MIFDPQDLSAKDRYKLMIGSVIPRPIALVSSVDGKGNRNLAPFSFFTIASVTPMTLVFFPQRSGSKENGMKDSAANILETKEFVVNVVSDAYLEKANLTSGLFSKDLDEFELSGLTPIASEKVKAYRVQESPISFECVLSRHLEIGNWDSGADAIFGEVVSVHVNDDIIENFRIDDTKLGLVSRLAGNFYARIGEKIEMERPKV